MELEAFTGSKCVLHVGCGMKGSGKLHQVFLTPQWQEIRLDINPDVKPDIVATIVDMPQVASNSVDAIWSAHNVEHLFAHDVLNAFREFYRVLRPGGFVMLVTPDLQAVAAYIAEGKLEDKLYDCEAGAIAPIDVVFGFRAAIAAGNEFMAHRTGFTAISLGQKLAACGFRNSRVYSSQRNYELTAMAYKPGNATPAAAP